MELIIDVEEVKVLVDLLGQLPTSSGAFPLREKLTAQANAFLASERIEAMRQELAAIDAIDAADTAKDSPKAPKARR